MREKLQEIKRQDFNNRGDRGDIKFVRILINNIAILENIFNEEDVPLEEKIRSNWNSYINNNDYRLENVQKMLNNNSIIEGSNIKEYEFVSKRDIFAINMREQYVILIYLKLMVMVYEKSEFMRNSEAKDYLDLILDKLNCMSYLKLRDIEFLSKDITNIYSNRNFYRDSKIQILKNIYHNRISMIRDKIEEITIHIENKVSTQVNKEDKTEMEGSVESVNQKNVFEITEDILELTIILRNKLKEGNSEDLGNDSNKQTEKNYDLLKQKYDMLKFEKEQLLEKKSQLEKENKQFADDLFKLGQEKKRAEEIAYLNVISEFFKCINGPNDLFLDKVYSYINGYEELSEEDIKRLFNNFISNIENFGVIKSPESNLNEKVKVNEESIEKYRCSKALAEEIIDENEIEVKIKYPTWIFVNKKSKVTNTLFNAMIDREV